MPWGPGSSTPAGLGMALSRASATEDPPGFGATPVSMGGQGSLKELHRAVAVLEQQGKGRMGEHRHSSASLQPSKPRRLPRAA